MKKIIALVLTLAMIMTLCVGFSVSAKVVETPVFMQDFESTIKVTNGPGGSALYPDRHWKSGGSNGGGGLAENVSYGDGKKSVVFFPNSTGQIRGTVGVDISKFEDGAKYQYIAMVKLNRASTVKDTALNITVGALKGYGYNAYTNTSKINSIKDSGDGWVRIETQAFTYFSANFDTEKNPPYFYVEFTGTKNSNTDYDKLYVDNVQVVKVTEEFDEASIFTKDNGTFDFESISADRALTKNLDYATNKNDISLASDIGGKAGKCLKLGYGSAYDRYVLLGFFDESDLGKAYDVTMKVYPKTIRNTDTKGIRFGVKGDPEGDGSNSYWGMEVWKTVGEAGSGKDLIAGQWNTVTFTANIKNATQGTTTVPTIKLAIDQRDEKAGYAVAEVYIDDITITKAETGSYFKNLSGKTLDFENFKTLSKGVDWKDGGGYQGSVTISNETLAHSGSYSLKIGGRNSKNCWTYFRAKLLSVFDNAKVGEAYKVTAYFKAGGANSDNTSIAFGAISNDATDLVSTRVDGVNNQTWTKGEFTYIVQNNATTGTKMDALFVDQGCYTDTQNVNTEIIYVDDITVEKLTPSASAPVFAYYNGKLTLDYTTKLPTKKEHLFDAAFVIDAAKFEGAQSPMIVVAGYDANDNLIRARVVEYKAGTTAYSTNTMGGNFGDLAKVKIFAFDKNGELVSAVSGAESYNYSK